MKQLRVIVTVLIALLLTGCGGEEYGAGIDKSLPKVKVKDLFLQKNLIGQKVTLEGKVGVQCQSNGCWFFLQDDTGQLYTDLATNKFSLPPMQNKEVAVSGTAAVSENNIFLIATGVEVK